MSQSENSKSGSENSKTGHLSGVVITGIFGIVIACVTGIFVVIGALIQNGFIAIGPSVQAGNPNSQPTIIVITATSQVEQPIIPVATLAVVNTSSPSGLYTCGEPAFNGDLQTTDPLFLRPEGYLSGWISSDPSTITLPDGTTKVFESQYVLIVEDLPSVQIKGVQRQAGKANSWGCWYSADRSTFIAEDAKVDFCKKKAGNNFAVFYSVSTSGFQELGSTTTISCP